MRNISDMNLDFSVTDKGENLRIVIVNAKTTSNPEWRIPRFQFLGFRVLLIAHEIDNVITENKPKARYQFTTQPGALEEAPDPAVSVCVTPDAWREPGEKARQ